MANTILPKRKSTPNSVPTASDLQPGELAVNTADGKLFTELSNGTVVNLPAQSLFQETVSPGRVTAAYVGSASAPAYSFSAGLGVGIYCPSSNLGLSAGGVERVRISSNGSVSIGSVAAGPRLYVEGGGSTSATTAFFASNSAFEPLLLVRNDGNVGIGTQSPATALDVNGTVTAKRADIGNSNTLDTAATYGSIIGGQQSKATLFGEIAHASGGFANTPGTAQHRILVARGITISGPVTIDIATSTFTRSGHSLSVGDTLTFSTTGSLPTGLTAGTTYHVIASGLTGSAFKVSTSAGGGAVTLSGTQSGTHTLIPTTALTLNGATGAATPQRLVIPERSTWAFSIKLSAYSSQNNQGAAWIAWGGLRRNLSTTVELGGSTQGLPFVENAFSSGLVSIDADNASGALDIRCTGVANQSIRWCAAVDICQVSFGTP
jgi:hypothetical protein